MKAVKTELMSGSCRVTLMMQNQLSRPVSSSDLSFKLEEISNSYGLLIGGELGAGELMFSSNMVHGAKKCPAKLTIWSTKGKEDGVFVNSDVAKFVAPFMPAKMVEEASLSGS